MIMTKNWRLRILFLFLGVALVSVFTLGIFAGSAHLAYDINRIVLIAVLMIVVAIELPGINATSIQNDIIVWSGLAIFLFSAAVSDFLSDSSLFQLSSFLLFSFFWLSVVGFSRFADVGTLVLFARRVIYVVVVLFSVNCILVLLLWMMSEDKNALKYAVLNAGYVNINFFGQMSTWLIPLCCILVLESVDRGFRKVSFLLVIGLTLLWLLILSLSVRGAMLSVFLSGVIAAILFRCESFRFLRTLFGTLLLAVVIWLIFEWSSSGFEEQKAQLIQLNPVGRLMLWKEAFLMSLVNFPFGMGSESWITHSEISDNFYLPLAHGHPHNMYLLWAAEYGWLAVLGVMIIVIGLIRKAILYRKLSRSESGTALDANELMIGLVVSSAAGMVHAGVSGVLLVPSSMIVGFMVLALTHGLLSLAVNNANNVELNAFRSKFIELVVSLGCGVFALLFVLNVNDYYLFMKQDYLRYAESESVTYFPRFWVHGNAVDVRGSYQLVGPKSEMLD